MKVINVEGIIFKLIYNGEEKLQKEFKCKIKH